MHVTEFCVYVVTVRIKKAKSDLNDTLRGSDKTGGQYSEHLLCIQPGQ